MRRPSDPDAPHEIPDLLPARMLNEFVYCPRLFYLEWVQSEWRESADTVEGSRKHTRVDRSSGALPAPDAEAADHPTISRSVHLSAPEEGLTARLDLIEAEDGKVVPVEYKKGSPPREGGAWDADEVQVGVQALILRDAGYQCVEGVCYYARSKTRVRIPVNDELIERTRDTARRARETAASGEIPPPLVDSPKCPGCSLVGICLPDETHLIAEGKTETGHPRNLLPARDDAKPLHVQSHGARVGKDGERLSVHLRDGSVTHVRLIDISQLVLLGNVSVSSQAIGTLVDRGIPICHFSFGGWFRGLTHGLGNRNAEQRLAQYAAAIDPERSLRLARGLVERKIRNSRTLVRRNHRSAPERTLRELARLADRAAQTDTLASLLGVEGLAARAYFSELQGMIKTSESCGIFDFEGRNRRPPRDPINSLLSLAYSILAKDWTVTLMSVGLDPYIGVYHRPRFGRPSLALDLMEEFRPLIADSVVLQLINNGEVDQRHFLARGGAVCLTAEGRKKFFMAYERRMSHEIVHPLFGYRVSYRRLLEVQARLFARTLTGELPEYTGFVTR